MGDVERLYDHVLREHLAAHRQMAFVSGPRQVGKTTTCRALADQYFSWDVPEHSRLIAGGVDAVAVAVRLTDLREAPPVIVFDELHRYPRWKSFLKGFFDLHERECRVVVTGSSRLDVYRRGGDSLMGRYFLYRMHPVSVGELLHPRPNVDKVLDPPSEPDSEQWDTLLRFGGFPEPFLAGNDRFARRWQALRQTQLIREDARDLTRVQELPLLEILARLLAKRSGSQLVIAGLARDTSVAPNTAKSWVGILCSLHHGFLVRPWSKNVSSSLRKEPRWFLRDWAVVGDEGARFETFVACHLLKAVETWTDLGLGRFELFYLRDKQKREVDFLVARDGAPWFLVEAKTSDRRLSPSLAYFQKQTQAPHAFQVVRDLPFVAADPFTRPAPAAVPARTLLSQLP
jgi:predicted AAA+ superfamily ATPase